MTNSNSLYTPRFFILLGSTLFYMTGYAMSYHFGQYIEFLGGDNKDLGILAGIAMIGSLASRLFIGNWIDRIGARTILVVGASLACVASLMILLVRELWFAGAMRLMIMLSIALYFTAVPILAARLAPPGRSAESLATIGLGGFLGMMFGPTLGDVIFSYGTKDLQIFQYFFICSAGSFFLGGVLGLLVPDSPRHHDRLISPRESIRIIRDNWPGMILLIGVAWTICQSFHSIFLERLAEDRGFHDIKLFFLTYCPTAMVLRILFRRIPQTIGRHRLIVTGMLFYGSGLLILQTVQSEPGLILPAMVMGVGHCFVFPSMVDIGASKLPPEHRGLGTAVILGMGDLGLLCGYMLWGGLTEGVNYNFAIRVIAGIGITVALLFGWTQRQHVIWRKNTATD